MIAENGSVTTIRLKVMRLSDMVVTCSGETEVEA